MDCMIRRFYHVDPSELTMTQYGEYLDYMGDIAEMESGSTDHRTKVERAARRRKRRGE